MQLPETPCPCGSTHYRTVLSGHYSRVNLRNFPFTIVRCEACALSRTFPVPDPSQYDDGYSIYTNDGRFGGATTDAWSAPIARKVARVVGRRKAVAGARFLDVGCHVGNLVVAAQELGFEAEGVDVDRVATEEARRLGRSVRTGSLELVDGPYDAVVLNHVLEHILDLDDFLADVARILAPDGSLFVFVPYHRGLLPRLMRDHWMGWSPAQHMWHFTPKTLGDAAARVDLRLVSARTHRVHEPSSPGVKGVAKAGVTLVSRAVGQGDLLEAVLERANGAG